MRAAIAVSTLVMGATMGGAQAQIVAPTAPSKHLQTVAFLPATRGLPTPKIGAGLLTVSDISTASSLAHSNVGHARISTATDTQLSDENAPDTALALLVAVAMGATVVRRSSGS